MTDVVPADVSARIVSARQGVASIRASRKRKLAQFHGLVTNPEASFAHRADNSPPPLPERAKFIEDNAVLQGPFLNERHLPARQIPPLKATSHHNAGVLTNDNASTAHFGKSEAGVFRPSSTPQQGPLGPSTRLEPPDETHTAAPNTLPISSTTTNDVAPVKFSHGASTSSFDSAAHAPRPQVDNLSRLGPITADNAGQLGSLRGPREGPVGREVSFAEPEKQDSSAVQPPAAEVAQVDAGHREADHGAMDIDEAPGPVHETPRLQSLRPTPLDAPKPPDALSSPGSTTQTATTPAVHDVSPDTSPDNGDPHYPADEEDLAPEETEKKVSGDGEPSMRSEGASADSQRDLGAPPTASVQSFAESVRTAAKSNIDMPASESQSNSEALKVPAQAEGLTGSSLGRDRLPEGPSTRLQDFSPADHHSSGLSVSIPVAHQELNSPSQELSPQTNPPTIVGSADLSGSFTGPEQRHIGSSSLSRKRSWASRQGRNMKVAQKVVFEKPPRKTDEMIITHQNQGSRIPNDDYFVPLFLEGFARISPWMKIPDQLLMNTHKAISSSDFNIALQESQACKVLRRIYHLQQHDKWSLRQIKRCPEPTRQASHWDMLLGEMKWMRTDFREERKWKRAVARNMADACAEWVASNDEERLTLQVNAKTPPPADSLHNIATSPNGVSSALTPVPDLVPSIDADSPMELDNEPQEWDQGTVAPSAIFTLPDDEVVFGLRQSEASDRLFSELPLYQAPLKVPQGGLTPVHDPDARWRRPALPLTKYVEGKLVLKPTGSPLKLEQSRFKYVAEDDESESEFADDRPHEETRLPPASTDVALFRPEMKMIRDRLHSAHQFRPPSESPMPSLSFYENRIGSIWTPADEDELKRQVREHTYNWSLISKNIASKSLFVSGEDRRTPWECFERWVGLEGFPPEVAKTQYFRTYNSRIESAKASSNAGPVNEGARQPAGPNGVVTQPQRRRPNTPSRGEKKTPKRYYWIMDAFRKLAKKNEAASTKQTQTASNQNRRPSENNPQKLPTKTPDDYSRMKAERDRQIQEKMTRFHQHQQQQAEAQRQAALRGGRVPNQMGLVPGVPSAAQAAQNAAAGHAGIANPLAARLAGPGQIASQARRLPIQQQQQALLNLQQQQLAAQLRNAGGLGPQAPMNVAGMPQAQNSAAQTQPHLQPHMVLEARRIQEQQRRRQLAQQATQSQMHQHPQQQQQQGGQQQAQQLPPHHSPPQAQAQQLPQNQQAYAMPNGSAAQSNSPNIRGGAINGVNHNNFVMNTMPYAPNGMAMATSPGGAAMNMQNGLAGSPPAGYSSLPKGLPASMQAHFSEIENQIRGSHPDLPLANIRQMALQRFQQAFRKSNNVAQNAMDVAAGNASLQQVPTAGIANASSPQQYAQMLRQQQQQQSGSQHAQQQAALAQQAARQASQPLQHQRQPSGGGTPLPNR